jgi:Flp pilus assembly protein TadG
MISRLHQHSRSDRGGALVELAVSLPLLVVILAGTVDFARVFYASVSLTNAARAGAMWGASKVSRSAPSEYATIEAKAISATNLTGVTASASRLCMCADNAGAFTPTSPPNDCDAACPTGSGGHIVMTVTVTTSKTFTTMMNILPGVPNSIPLSRAATLRVVN